MRTCLRVRCVFADVHGAAIFLLQPDTCLDELRELHRMAPRAAIEIIELEEVEALDSFGRSGVPCWTRIAWTWRPRLHRLAKGAAQAREARQARRRG